MQVYMVMGMTGEYDSRSSWMVKAYVMKDFAEHHAKRAQERADEIIMKALNGKKSERPWDADFDLWDDVMDNEENAFDPKFHCDFGTQIVGYYVAHTPVEVDTTT